MYMLQRQIVLVVFLLIFCPVSLLAQNLIDCETTIITPELISCSWEAFKHSDKELNDHYRKFIQNLSGENAQSIKAAQVAWIRFKEKNCQLVYDAVFPGTEAPIDKNYCLQIVTKDRITEIKRIMERKQDNCSKCDDFFRSLAVLTALGYKKSDVLSKINTYVFNRSGKEWNNYVRATCDFSVKYVNDKRDICEARLNFIYLRNYEQVTDDD